MDRWDGIALVGLVMVGVGLWFVYWPLALIVPGAALVGLGVVGARRGGETRDGRSARVEGQRR
jgi:CHASE2 domain-containing sensor protein